MARCYSVPVRNRHPSVAGPLPFLWLVSDARNDADLECALDRLPPDSGFIFRHYHLPLAQRRARFERLSRHARRRGHAVILAGSPRQARLWGADGAYGNAARLAGPGQALRLVTVHSLRELRQARQARASAVLISPVFATRSHPGSASLGFVRFQALAALSQTPVIALGGMNHARARTHRIRRWAAIDGLSGESRL